VEIKHVSIQVLASREVFSILRAVDQVVPIGQDLCHCVAGALRVDDRLVDLHWSAGPGFNTAPIYITIDVMCGERGLLPMPNIHDPVIQRLKAYLSQANPLTAFEKAIAIRPLFETSFCRC
jgi:hypothetical protein